MLARKIGLTFVVKVSASLCAYLVSILLIRKGGTETAGQFYSWVAYLLLASSIVRFGLDHKIVKEVAQSTKKGRKKVLGKALLICTLLSAIVIPIIYLISIEIGKNTPYTATIIAISCFLFSVIYLFGNIFQGLDRADMTILSQEILIWVALFTSLIFIDVIDIEMTWNLYLVGIVLSLAVSSYYLHAGFDLKPKLCGKIELARYLKETVPYFSGIAGHVALQWSPLIFLSIFATSTESGQFVAIYRTSMLIAFLLGIFNLVTNPIYAKYFAKNDVASVGKLARTIALTMLIISLPMFVSLTVFSADLMAMFGESFKALSYVLIYISCAQMFNAITGSAGYILTMGGQAKLVEKSTLITVGLVFILGPPLIYEYALWGAASVSFISVIVFNSLNTFLLYKHMNIVILPNLQTINDTFSIVRENFLRKKTI
ncbi:oligosaccharide flippase family protein [Enterovibrio calviensis]|uniref:oligosaccharide flippase family protein n=1 Tax=Enterovibrio calviensis TaxID=91359 RepID=UPI00048152D4|nr:oligosaccharide flippase family protein [Enterovibrio calviensis]